MMLRSKSPLISVIIPCYNEEANLRNGVLDEVYTYLSHKKFLWEVIIINDDSTDKSKDLLEHFVHKYRPFFLFDIPHGGKPAAVWFGINKAKGDIVLFTDMDQSAPISELDKLLIWYGKGYDVVIGSRGSARNGFSPLRKFGSFVFNTFRRSFILENIDDTQCGFKLCRRQIAMEIFPRLSFFKEMKKPTGWNVTAFDVELLYLFEKSGHQIKEVAIKWYNRDKSITKNPKGELTYYVNESIEMSKQIFNIKINELKRFLKRWPIGG